MVYFPFFLSLLFYFKYRTSCLVCVILFHSNSSSSFSDYYFWRWLHFFVVFKRHLAPEKILRPFDIPPPLSCWKVIRSGTNSFLSTSGDWPTFFVGRLNGTNTRSKKGKIVCSIVPLWWFLLHFLPFIWFQSAARRCVCVWFEVNIPAGFVEFVVWLEECNWWGPVIFLPGQKSWSVDDAIVVVVGWMNPLVGREIDVADERWFERTRARLLRCSRERFLLLLASQPWVGEGWNVLFACVSSRKKGRCPPLTCTSFLSFFLLLASSRPTTQTAQVCVCVWTKGTCAPPPASPKCALLLLTCCCAAIIYPATVCLIFFSFSPAVGRESIKQFHHFAQLLLQLTRTLTVDASPVLPPKSVARRERGGSSCCCS